MPTPRITNARRALARLTDEPDPSVPEFVFSDVKHAPKGSPPRYLRRHVSQAAASPATRRARKAKARIDRIIDRHLSVGERLVVRGRKVR